MIRGFFREEAGRRRPFILSLVEFPTLGRSGNVAFLVDTGADASLLAPRDAANLGIDLRRLARGPSSTGVGGTTRTVQAPARITFDQQSYQLTLRVLAPRGPRQRDALQRIPSLLGRDILSQVALFVDDRSGRVLLLNAQETAGLNLPD